MSRFRLVPVALAIVPCGLFLLGLIIGVICSDDYDLRVG